jgi:hypothetical protein
VRILPGHIALNRFTGIGHFPCPRLLCHIYVPFIRLEIGYLLTPNTFLPGKRLHQAPIFFLESSRLRALELLIQKPLQALTALRGRDAARAFNRRCPRVLLSDFHLKCGREVSKM